MELWIQANEVTQPPSSWPWVRLLWDILACALLLLGFAALNHNLRKTRACWLMALVGLHGLVD